MSVYDHFETLQVHAGHTQDPATGACATPLYQTASFCFDNMDHAARLFQLQEEGHIYTRLSNPTVAVLEERVAALEKCTGALAVSSGQAAHFLTFQNLSVPGDNFIAFPSLYGGTYTLFRDRFRSLGIEFRFAAGNEPRHAEALIDERTKGLFVETIANSDYHVPQFDALAELCQKHRIPLIVDNTFGGGGGHIITAERLQSGQLRLYDPQTGEHYNDATWEHYTTRIVLGRSIRVYRSDGFLINNDIISGVVHR
ncbi:MAG: aminotransferase class I/II-fold pyridoxal phosphate-dependent enzyme [Bacteroidales bacterium]|jgi:O-acetylhomoserine/O-acetylserine sulfhydrylase|nr:aminotransferase class I/II-fold pyridoxal phosphate-dependent enzyme [Bacteroidales bacterium]HKM31882.1 aminotransferase class I/II-fold pyridoxal phosphate-dependent enzyme [Bacteroidales bacterium]